MSRNIFIPAITCICILLYTYPHKLRRAKKDTLTGSQKQRTIDELSIHPNSLFVAALNMGGSLTIGNIDKNRDGIKRLIGADFWSLIGLDYESILDKISQVIRELDTYLYQ